MKNGDVAFTKDMMREAADMTDRAGKLDGFKRGSAQWNRYYQKYLQETHASVDPHAIKQNPTVSEHIVYNSYPEVFGSGGFVEKALGSFTSDEANRYKHRIESAINNLNSVFLEIVMKMKTKHQGDKFSDFDVPKQADEDTKRRVWINQYIRMTTLSFIYASLDTFFKAGKQDILAILKNSNVPELDSSQLHKIENRTFYSQNLKKRLEVRILKKKSE